MHILVLYKKAILHNTVYQKLSKKKLKPFQISQWPNGNWNTLISRPEFRWHRARRAIMGLESCPLRMNVFAPKDQHFITKASPLRDKRLYWLQARRGEKGIKNCWIHGPREDYCNKGWGTIYGKGFLSILRYCWSPYPDCHLQIHSLVYKF